MKSEYVRLAQQLDPRTVAMAIKLADEAATAAVECHTIPRADGWRDTSGEPVGEDIRYLVARGMLALDETNPAIVRFKSEAPTLNPPYPFCCHPEKCCATGRCERTVNGERWCCAD